MERRNYDNRITHNWMHKILLEQEAHDISEREGLTHKKEIHAIISYAISQTGWQGIEYEKEISYTSTIYAVLLQIFPKNEWAKVIGKEYIEDNIVDFISKEIQEKVSEIKRMRREIPSNFWGYDHDFEDMKIIQDVIDKQDELLISIDEMNNQGIFEILNKRRK